MLINSEYISRYYRAYLVEKSKQSAEVGRKNSAKQVSENLCRLIIASFRRPELH